MIDIYNNKEFRNILKPVLCNNEYLKTRDIAHHGTTRFNHSMRVAFYTYKITKFLGLEYKDATVAALLHDFFIDEVADENMLNRLIKHPDIAVKNATKYYDLNDRQVDIIRTHMFPITFRPPKYIESWIVDLVDDGVAIYEKGHDIRGSVRTALTFSFVILINILNIRL